VDAGRLTNVACNGDGVTHTEETPNLQLCPLTPESEMFRAMPFLKHVQAALTQLIGDGDPQVDIVQYLSQVFFKPANGLGTSIHQDNHYFQIPQAKHGVAMWTAIHDVTAENGEFCVTDQVESLLEHERDGMSDHHFTCQTSVVERRLELTPLQMAAGSVVFFHFGVPHSTRGNSSAYPRAGLAFHFLRSESYRDRQFSLPDGADWRTPVVAGANCTYGLREYGSKINIALLSESRL
jgi:hypothetical protein